MGGGGYGYMCAQGGLTAAMVVAIGAATGLGVGEGMGLWGKGRPRGVWVPNLKAEVRK